MLYQTRNPHGGDIYEEKRNCHIGTNYRSTDDRSCRTRIPLVRPEGFWTQ